MFGTSQPLSQVSLTYCQVGRDCLLACRLAGPIVFISLPLNTALGEKKEREREGKWERWGVKRRRWGTILGGSVATRQCVYHNSCCPQGKLGRPHQRLIHSPPLPSETHTHTHTHTHTLWERRAILSFSAKKDITREKSAIKGLILRLKEVMFQPLLPKSLALGGEVCFYDCSGFCVNELKFHLSGAPCICQHILQIESRAGLASTHFSHRLLLIGSSP